MRLDELKPYKLEVYGPGSDEKLFWTTESEAPFTPMNVGHRLHLPEARGARRDELLEIVDVEHVIWTAGERIRYVTRVHTRAVTRE